MTSKTPTSSQLRDDIDEGRTGDKIAARDPAAAPLGTDDEAADTPPSPEEVGIAREHERAHGNSTELRRQTQASRRHAWWIIALAAGGLALAIVVLFL